MDFIHASARNINKSASIQSTADAERLPLKLIQLDVTDDRSVKDAVQKIVLEKGRIDVLVNNAGYGLFGAFEDLAMDEIKAQFETNFFGVIRARSKGTCTYLIMRSNSFDKTLAACSIITKTVISLICTTRNLWKKLLN